MAPEPIIHIEGLHKHFGETAALNGVSLDVYPGEVVLIIGPSGSGKSTLLRCINRLETFQAGTVIVDDIPLTTAENINAIRTEVGMVFQSFNLFPHLSVLENVTIAQKVVRKRSKAEAIEIAQALLTKVGIPEKASDYPGQLSGGQQQ
ncbi:MAG TPA: peptide ABC transporter ATP-binding protein, partial [Anaerolineaceae bacterium]|nr:peptide ABC transporter ATP-binding protein [Anaerolineaceae bacterium]